MPAVIWNVHEPEIAMVIATLSFIGWVIVLTSTFLINHFELFGLRRVANNLVGREMPAPVFRTPFFYRFVRHPIYLGFIIAFWAAPTMSAGHLLFAAVTTAYIFVGIMLESAISSACSVTNIAVIGNAFPCCSLGAGRTDHFQLSVRRRKNDETYWKLFLRCGRGAGHGAPEGMGYCHCRSCRSWSGGPVNAFTLWKPEAVRITAGAQHVATFEKTPISQRKYCAECGGHLMTNHPTLGLVDVFAATFPTLPFTPGVHVNYAETVLPMRWAAQTEGLSR